MPSVININFFGSRNFEKKKNSQSINLTKVRIKKQLYVIKSAYT